MDSNLAYLLIGLFLGIVLGINILLVYNHFFNPKSYREQKLRSKVNELERKLKKKDHYITKAIKTVKNGEKRGA